MRYQFKAKGIKYGWQEIARIGNTQKIVTTTGHNTFDKIISVKNRSEPSEKLIELFDILQIKHHPFNKRKSVVHKPTLKKNENLIHEVSPPT